MNKDTAKSVCCWMNILLVDDTVECRYYSMKMLLNEDVATCTYCWIGILLTEATVD